MSRTDNHQKLQAAIVLQQNGKLNEAADLYRQLIKQDANNFHALHFLGVIEATVGNIEQAKLLMARSLAIQPPNVQFVENYATLLFQAGDYKAALQICRQGSQLSNSSISLLYISAIALFGLNNFQESIAQFDKVLLLQPKHIAALNERGSALSKLKQYDAALATIDKALALDPRYAEAHLNKGNVYSALKRHNDAIVAFDKALALNAGLANAWLGRGNVLRELKRFDEAFGAYDKGLSLQPGLAEAWLGRGNIFYELKRYDEAFGAYDKALSLQPGLAEAWLGRGNVLRELKSFEEALVAYDKALATNRDLTGLEGVRLHTKMLLCDWSNFDTECAHLMSSVRNLKVSSPPFPLLAIPSSPADQLQCAKLWASNVCPPSDRPARQSERYNHDRIRVAYVSTDLHDHPVGRQIVALFEQHDKSRFEVTAISLGPDRQSDLQLRIKNAFEHFVDARSHDDRAIAELLRQREIDIAVDLNGFTDGGRLNIFAQRPAPIQVNYLGYAGTLGVDYFDYILADQTVIPEDQFQFYSENVIWLPNSFMPSDPQQPMSGNAPARGECGLPGTAFVFCCFHNTYKITPDVFDIWMRLLEATKDSVLWLREGNSTASENLRREAERRGISSERLIFAPRVDVANHVARHRLADLFLDILPYNAHTSASDALWAGLPVLTCLGETFAGRVAASLLNAIHLPELITPTLEAYEQTAVDLATHPEKLTAIKHKLAENRLTTPLFDTKLFTKHIEAAYTTMYERHQAGLAPDHIVTPT